MLSPDIPLQRRSSLVISSPSLQFPQVRPIFDIFVAVNPMEIPRRTRKLLNNLIELQILGGLSCDGSGRSSSVGANLVAHHRLHKSIRNKLANALHFTRGSKGNQENRMTKVIKRRHENENRNICYNEKIQKNCGMCATYIIIWAVRNSETSTYLELFLNYVKFSANDAVWVNQEFFVVVDWE